MGRKKKPKLYSVFKPVTHRIAGETILPGGTIDLSHVKDEADLAWMFERGLIGEIEEETQPVEYPEDYEFGIDLGGALDKEA